MRGGGCTHDRNDMENIQTMSDSPPRDKANNEKGDGEHDGRDENGGGRGRAVDGNLTFGIAYLLTPCNRKNIIVKKTNKQFVFILFFNDLLLPLLTPPQPSD